MFLLEGLCTKIAHAFSNDTTVPFRLDKKPQILVIVSKHLFVRSPNL